MPGHETIGRCVSCDPIMHRAPQMAWYNERRLERRYAHTSGPHHAFGIMHNCERNHKRMSRMYGGGPPNRGGPPGMQGRMAGGPLQKARMALMNGQPALAVEICRRELEKKDDITTRLLLAQALVQMQRAKEAVEEARHIVNAQPKNIDGLMLLASALVQTNQVNPPKEALEVAERAVQLQPKAARTHIQLAEVLLARRDFDRAKAEAEAATQLEPRLAAAHLIRGMSLLELKDSEGALQDSNNAIR
jgi:tetratricopeptide (TPR) repeat protein